MSTKHRQQRGGTARDQTGAHVSHRDEMFLCLQSSEKDDNVNGDGQVEDNML